MDLVEKYLDEVTFYKKAKGKGQLQRLDAILKDIEELRDKTDDPKFKKAYKEMLKAFQMSRAKIK